jgi:hypothetical protein
MTTEVATVPYGTAADPVLERTGADPRWHAQADADNYPAPGLMLSDKMTTLVKGAGYARVGGNMPLSDDEAVFKKAMRAEDSFREAIRKGHHEPEKVLKGISKDFSGQFGAFMSMSPQNQAMQFLTKQLNTQLSDALGKSITLTSPLSSGFVPFDL